MRKRHWKMLEKVFAADMAGTLPFQTKSTEVIVSLHQQGYVETLERKEGNLTLVGWGITRAGHIAYCEWASKQPSNEPE